MIYDAKEVKYALTVCMPKDSNLEWVRKMIIAAFEEKDRFSISGLYLIEEKHIGEIIG